MKMCVIIGLIISRSSHDAHVYVAFTCNSIPYNGRGIARNDKELFHQIIAIFVD